ncbi:MAG TPA: type II 3-dehydroquinate dehydratase [bacterium]|nr:type II 3-dehydroquinate dehydratase [bacterium]
MAKILLVNGPNLNLLGEREPELYGRATLADVVQRVRQRVQAAGHTLLDFQSNSEGDIVTWLQNQRPADFLLLNAASYTHTSVAIRDAVKLMCVPFVEIHISNVYKREAFRHRSLLSDVAEGVIAGLGTMGYELAAQFAVEALQKHR